jgi:phosphoglycerate dehydrogenase-like enzyme
VNVVFASPIDRAAIDHLSKENDVSIAYADGADAASMIAACEVLVFRSGVDITASLLDRAPRLGLIIRAGSGLDNIDLDRVRERRIRLVRIPGPSARAVAELAFAMMLALARNVVLADRLLREGHWPKHELGGPLLAGKTLGVVGVGNIGTRAGRMGAAWGMDVVGCVRRFSPGRAAELKDLGITLLDDLWDVAARADFLTLHVPLTEETRHLIDATVLTAVKPGAFLVNTSRGGVVDERALLPALRDGMLAGAGLDVHEQEGEGTRSPFADLPNVVLTPHIGGMATDSQRDIGRRVVELLGAFAAGSLDEEARDGELVI